MKKLVKALTAIGTAALAVAGGVLIFRKFFAKDEELDEAFDDEELFEEETEDSVKAFEDESEIFEDETAEEPAAPAEEAETPKETPEEEEAEAAPEAPAEETGEEKEA